MFQEDNSSEAFWKEIDGLVELLAESQILEDAFDLIKSQDFSVSTNAKIRHFKNLYDEHCYNLYMWRQAEQEVK